MFWTFTEGLTRVSHHTKSQHPHKWPCRGKVVSAAFHLSNEQKETGGLKVGRGKRWRTRGDQWERYREKKQSTLKSIVQHGERHMGGGDGHAAVSCTDWKTFIFIKSSVLMLPRAHRDLQRLPVQVQHTGKTGRGLVVLPEDFTFNPHPIVCPSYRKKKQFCLNLTWSFHILSWREFGAGSIWQADFSIRSSLQRILVLTSLNALLFPPHRPN